MSQIFYLYHSSNSILKARKCVPDEEKAYSAQDLVKIESCRTENLL